MGENGDPWQSVTFNFTLPKVHRDELEALARAADRTPAAELRRALRMYLTMRKERVGQQVAELAAPSGDSADPQPPAAA